MQEAQTRANKQGSNQHYVICVESEIQEAPTIRPNATPRSDRTLHRGHTKRAAPSVPAPSVLHCPWLHRPCLWLDWADAVAAKCVRRAASGLCCIAALRAMRSALSVAGTRAPRGHRLPARTPGYTAQARAPRRRRERHLTCFCAAWLSRIFSSSCAARARVTRSRSPSSTPPMSHEKAAASLGGACALLLHCLICGRSITQSHLNDPVIDRQHRSHTQRIMGCNHDCAASLLLREP